MAANNQVGASAKGDDGRRHPTSWLRIGAAIALSVVAATFYGINDYSTASNALVATARRNSQRFEAVYGDAAETRLAALRLGVDLILANPEITAAFARDDRPGLLRTVVPLFSTVLQPRYDTNQFNFWTPPAKLYLRAIDPKEFGTDGSAARRSVVLSMERRAAIAGMETGLGGRLGIRAMAPILDGTRLVGVVELGDDLVAILRRARTSTAVEFAAGLDRKRSDEVERIPRKDVDAIQGTDVFFEYSSEDTARLVRSVSFDARNPAGALTQANGHNVFVRPFAIANFAGAPTVVVATVFDLTQPFDDARQSSAIKAGLLFLVLAVAAVLGLMQFQKIQQSFARVVFGERRRLHDTTKALEAARLMLKDVELIKQGFFTNMVAAVTEPLQAVHGQLQVAIPAIDAAIATVDGNQALSERLSFSLDEIGRLTRLLADYRKIELFRQKLVREPAATTALAEIVSAVLGSELARFTRLPQLAISAAVPDSLPLVRASADQLRYAIASLVSYAAETAGQGTIHIEGLVDEAGWIKLAITGSAFATAGMPTDALLEDSRQFIARLSGSVRPSDASGTMMAIVLARTIIENAGGHLGPAKDAAPGFVMLLPSAV